MLLLAVWGLIIITTQALTISENHLEGILTGKITIEMINNPTMFTSSPTRIVSVPFQASLAHLNIQSLTTLTSIPRQNENPEYFIQTKVSSLRSTYFQVLLTFSGSTKSFLTPVFYILIDKQSIPYGLNIKYYEFSLGQERGDASTQRRDRASFYSYFLEDGNVDGAEFINLIDATSMRCYLQINTTVVIKENGGVYLQIQMFPRAQRIRLGYSLLYFDSYQLVQKYRISVDWEYISMPASSTEKLPRHRQYIIGIISFHTHPSQTSTSSILCDERQSLSNSFAFKTKMIYFEQLSKIEIPTLMLFSVSASKPPPITCPQGQFNDQNNCLPCSSNCKTCNQSSSCLSCDDNKNRALNSGACVCKQSYFQDSTLNQCNPCPTKCKVCSNSNTCTTCHEGQYILHQGQNFKSFYYLTSSNECQLCHNLVTDCEQCSASSNCTKCLPYRILQNQNLCDSCSLSNSFVVSNSKCVRCWNVIPSCIICQDTLICTTCNVHSYMAPLNDSCIACHFSCSYCSSPSEYDCTSCSWRRHEFDSKCICNDRFYENNQYYCGDCNKTCATCENSTNCLTCVPDKNLLFSVTQQVCNCVVPGQYVLINDQECIFCNESIINCRFCQNSTVCMHCYNDDNYTMNSFRNSCLCSYGKNYFRNGTLQLCTLCDDIVPFCTQCEQNSSRVTSCTKCKQTFLLQTDGLSCYCDNDNNYFLKKDICIFCSDQISYCLNCSSSSECNQCDEPMTKMSSDNRSCDCNVEEEYHLDENQECVLCPDMVLGCLNCSDYRTCQICDQDNNFVLSGSGCVCQDGYFLNGSNCQPCEISCLTCVNTSVFCLTCNNTALRVFNAGGNTCDCTPLSTDCRYSGMNQCQNHTCSFLTPIKVVDLLVVKSQHANNLTVTFKIQPNLQQYGVFDYLSSINLNLPASTSILISRSGGTYTADIQYTENIQGLETRLKIQLKQSNLWFFKLSEPYEQQYQLNVKNNLAVNYYPQEIYDQEEMLSKIIIGLVSVNFIIYLVGLFASKIIVTEMMGVLQIAYFGTFMLNFGDPLVVSLTNLKYANGFNYLFLPSQQNQPNRVYYSDYYASPISNFNITLILLFIPLILSFITYKIHKQSTQYRIPMEKAWRLFLGQWFLTLFIFVLYNYSSSLSGIFVFTATFNVQFYISIIVLVLVTGIFGFLLWMYVTKDQEWMGEYKSKFNTNRFPQLYYIIPILQRFVIGAMINAGNSSYVPAIISILIFLADIIVISITKPFVRKSQNIVSIVTYTFSILILLVYTALSIRGPNQQPSFAVYFPYIITGVLGLNTLTSAVFVTISVVQKIKERKSNIYDQMQMTKEYELEQDLNKKMQKVVRDARNQNINNKVIPQKKIKAIVTPRSKQNQVNMRQVSI